METLQDAMAELETQFAQLEPDSKQYIAPEGTEVHAYAVKRPYGTYWYNKLAAHRDMFYPRHSNDWYGTSIWVKRTIHAIEKHRRELSGAIGWSKLGHS